MSYLVIKQFISRNKILSENGFDSYSDFLDSDIWKAIKAKRDKKIAQGKVYWTKCYCCNSVNNLQLHHLKYKRILKVSLVHIVPVCRRCHKEIHDRCSKSKKLSIKAVTKKLKKKYNRVYNKTKGSILNKLF